MEETFDYIVVGAGPSGSALAARLADSPGAPSVAIIETGEAKASMLSDMPLGFSRLVPKKNASNYAYQTEPQAELNGRRGYQPRGRGVGGSSLINAMICIRGQQEDYDGWAALGCEGWAWKDVLPLFRRSETNSRGKGEWHGGSGPLQVSDQLWPSPVSRAFVQAAVEAGYRRNSDFNGPSQEGVGFYQVFQKGGQRLNAGRAYLQSGPMRPNLRIISGVQARRVIFNDKRRATGVVLGRAGKESILHARGEIILSSGAFGSPQLLMLSGVGPAEDLKALGLPLVQDAPEVGANLQDHLDFTINTVLKDPSLVGPTLGTLAKAAVAFPRYRNSPTLLSTNVSEAGGFIRSDVRLDRPDLQLHFCIALVDDHGRKPHFKTGFALHVCALRPKSRGTVSLRSAEASDAPIIDPRFLSDPDDLDLLVAGAKIARRILNAPALAQLGGKRLYMQGDEDDGRLRALIRNHADSIYHPVGTCRMGKDARSVVDPQLRVRGVSGLRIADCSIMPTLVSGNTQAPAAMIGEKAANLILAAPDLGP